MTQCRCGGDASDAYSSRPGVCRKCHLAATNATRERAMLTPDGRARALLDGARKSARRRGQVVEITREWIAERIGAGVCQATGHAFDLRRPSRGRSNPMAPSLDRIDPDQGYTEENTRVVVWALNAMRNEYGDDVLDVVFRAYAEERACHALCL